MTEKEKPEKKKKRLIRVFWLLVASPFLAAGLLLFIAASSDLPGFEELENPNSNLASEILTADQKLLGTYFRENRTNVRYDQISPYLIKALVATEDERYYDHSGIDFRALLRVVKGVLTSNTSQGGGSTITQQLAKNLFPRERLNLPELILRKFKEWIIAVRLEKTYTKEEILMMYLNTFDFINNAVGVKSASNVYFGVSPDSLRIEQAAMLVGMAKNPSLFNPLRRPDTVIHRRMIVLAQMKKQDMITQTQYDSLRELPLGLNYSRVDHNEGLAPYFREILRAEITKLFEPDENGKLQYSKAGSGEPYDIYRDGLRIYTTIDSRLQGYAEWAVGKHLGGELQADFDKVLKKRKNKPFYGINKKEIDRIIGAGMVRSERYKIVSGQQCGNCKRFTSMQENTIEGVKVHECTAGDCGEVRRAIPKDSIRHVFKQKVPMRIFSWRGEIDTLMSPLDSIKYYKGFLQAGLMSMDPRTGMVRAWVGGINPKHFKFDHVKQSRRQVGSTFKPFIYATAIKAGYHPCMEVPNRITCFDMPDGQPQWCPKNSDLLYGGEVSLKCGLANSMNTITAWVMKQISPDPVVKLAKSMGIKSPLDPVPSLCLGVADVSVYEMTAAFSVFANKGMYIEPIIIARVEDKNGNVIFDALPEISKALDEYTAYIMLDMLKGVTTGVKNKFTGKTLGSGMRITGSYREYGGYKHPLAAKTGTTQQNSDGWYLGITPDLVTGVWVGAEDRSVHFSRTYFGQGANTALPIFGYYMKEVYADSTIGISTEDFEAPEGDLPIDINCKNYNTAGPSWDGPSWGND